MSTNLLNIVDNARIESIKKLKKLPPLKIKKEHSTDEFSNYNSSITNNFIPSGNEESESGGYNETPINSSIQSPDYKQISKKSIGEISNDVRQNIRKKAKTALEVKRGSIQLQKRLLRSKTLTSNIPKQIFNNDSDKLDNQIERVIKLGEKFETKKETDNFIEDIIQYKFATQNFEKSMLTNKNELLFDYTPASPLYIDSNKLKEFITIFDDKIFNKNIEEGNNLNIINSKNNIKFRRRLGKKFITKKNTILGMDKNESCEKKVFKYNRVEWEETSLVENVYKEKINITSNINNSKKRQYENIKIYLSKIKLHHHWLFCKEHVLCRKVEEIYEILLYKANIILDYIKKYLTIKTENEDINNLEKEIEKNVKDYQKTGEEIQYYWEKLCNLREEQGYQKSPLMLTIKEVQEQDLSFFNPIIQDFYRNPIFLLTYDNENIKVYENNNNTDNNTNNIISIDKLSSKEKELDMYFTSLKKCEWETQIFFNDIFVCHSKTRSLNKNFEIVFNEEYNLQVHDVPETIVIVLYERFNRGVFKCIAKIGLPLEKEDDDINNEACNHFGTDTVYEGINGSIGAGGISRDPLSGVIFTKLDGYGILSHEEARKKDEHLYTSFDDENFQLIPPETKLIKDDLFEDDIRINALIIRFKKSQLLGNIEKPIPIYANEIESKYYKIGETTTEEYERFGFGIENIKLSSIVYAIKLRTEFIQNMESNKRKIKTYSDIVKEESIPNLFSGFSTLFGNRDISRKLKPMRNEIKKQITTGNFKFNFIINIQSAINIGDKIDGSIIQSFVEITFQSQVFKTKICPGKNPKWQETIVIPFDNSSFENKNFNSIIEIFTIRLYDYIIVPLMHDDREMNTIHEQIEYRYLGKVDIPFYTIYMNGKIDGLVPIHRTSFSNGYVFEGNSYLKLMISLDPLIASPIDEHIPTGVSNEDDIIIEKYISWKKRCQLLYPNRRYKGIVFNSEGKSILVSRYINTVKPPSFLDSFSNNKLNLVKKAIDVIKCLPTINDPIMFPGVCDLWTNVDQTLTIGCGNEEEHALILICWLLYYQIEAYLVLGNALPEGLRAGYVIITLEEKLYIINPVEGFLWDIKDSYIPLLSIGTVITKNNIYGNIQKNELPYYMSFDLTREDCWKKLFDNDFTVSSLNTIQNETVIYQNINDGLLIELKSSLERDIKTKIDESRQFGIPQWNILVARTLKDIISDIIIIDNYKEIEKRLQENFGTLFKIHAVILKIPFISKKSLINEILSTKIHLNNDIGVQFAVSVHLIPYINNILQCNVGLASLIPV
uniref:C2 domain-containing protein n=1 Tax=Strongyloides stercoralis TaxID=6248 RepID=A0A0K0DTM3_STRER